MSVPCGAGRIVYFDLETQRSAAEVGGWRNKRAMRMSIGVTYDTVEQKYRIFDEARVQELLQVLFNAELVVGFNILHFDYEVLRAYSPRDPARIPTLDLLEDVSRTLGHRLSLDAIAQATLGAEKIADGLDAIRWFREGKIEQIAEYCCYDVKLTRLIHEYGRRHRQVLYTSRGGIKRAVPVSW